MSPSTAVVIRGLRLKYKCNNKHVFCNKRFKAFLEGQASNGKPAPFLATYSFDAATFFTYSHYFCTLFVLYKCNCKSLV